MADGKAVQPAENPAAAILGSLLFGVWPNCLIVTYVTQSRMLELVAPSFKLKTALARIKLQLQITFV